MKRKLPGIRGSIAILILVLSGLSGAFSFRFFPFSDYPMFATVKEEALSYALAFKGSDGGEAFLTNRDLYPFTRLHIHQMISLTLMDSKSDFQWTEVFLRRLQRRHPDVRQVLIQQVRFNNRVPGELTVTHRSQIAAWPVQ